MVGLPFRLSCLIACCAAINFAVIARAQVVQLPIFRQFGVSTSVLVPDGGSVHLGGNRSAAMRSNQFGALGVPLSRSAGAVASASGVTISATIHDFEAMDQALLQQAAARRGGRPLPHSDEPSFFELRDAPPIGLAEIRRRQATPSGEQGKKSTADQAAEKLIAQGDAAWQNGNPGAARVYYQMAARRGRRALRDAAQAKYEMVGHGSASASALTNQLRGR
jgi:hypothetical protein